MAELSAKDVCAPMEGLRARVRRLAVPQWLLASHCTPNSRFVPSFPIEGQKSSVSACLLPAAPVFGTRDRCSHSLKCSCLGKLQLPMGIQPLALPLAASPPLSPPGLAERCTANAIRHVGTARHVTVRNRCSVPLKQ